MIELVKQNVDIDIKEVMVWSILYRTLKVELLLMTESYPNYSSLMEEKGKLLKEKNELEEFVRNNGQIYPSAYILMFRGYFLDEVLLILNIFIFS